eukprot:354459-Prorocentrum_minimum.AAC.3
MLGAVRTDCFSLPLKTPIKDASNSCKLVTSERVRRSNSGVKHIGRIKLARASQRRRSGNNHRSVTVQVGAGTLTERTESRQLRWAIVLTAPGEKLTRAAAEVLAILMCTLPAKRAHLRAPRPASSEMTGGHKGTRNPAQLSETIEKHARHIYIYI